MSPGCPVLLLGEGAELDDVASVLRGLGAAFEECRGAEAAGPVVLPRDLLVATARRALALPRPARGHLEARGPARVAVVTSDSPSLRAGLREAGFDLLLRRPVHPTALRLLLLRLLYRGPERRRETRVSVGLAARYRAGLLWRKAVLTELSTGGCRLLAARTARPGWSITVEIPDPAASGAPLRLLGRVVRANAVSPVDPTFTLALSFVKLTEGTRQRLARIVAAHERGPASLPGGWELEEPAPAPGAAQESALQPEVPETTPEEPEPQEGIAPEATPAGADRRRAPRAAYTTRVVTLGEEAAHVVMGRDLSPGGIRIEPHGGLERGQRVALALHGTGLPVPLVVRGSVLRDDGDAGLVIRFDPLGPAQSEALKKILAGLGGIEALGTSAAGCEHVVTRILDGQGAPQAA